MKWVKVLRTITADPGKHWQAYQYFCRWHPSEGEVMTKSREAVIENLQNVIKEIEKVKAVDQDNRNLAAECVHNAISWIRRWRSDG